MNASASPDNLTLFVSWQFFSSILWALLVILTWPLRWKFFYGWCWSSHIWKFWKTKLFGSDWGCVEKPDLQVCLGLKTEIWDDLGLIFKIFWWFYATSSLCWSKYLHTFWFRIARIINVVGKRFKTHLGQILSHVCRHLS